VSILRILHALTLGNNNFDFFEGPDPELGAKSYSKHIKKKMLSFFEPLSCLQTSKQ